MNRSTLTSAVGIGMLLAGAATLRAQAAEGDILRLDPAMDAIAPADARIEKVAGGFQFTEGPLWRPEGRLWFSDVVGNVVRALSPGGEVQVLIRDAAGTSTAPEGSYIGPNGMTAGPDGSVLMAQHWNRQIVRVAPDLSISPYLDRFEGKRFNSPNDLIFAKDGGLYFTDPPYGLPGQDEDPAKELDFNGVFLHRDGELRVVIRDLERPNGLALSPDGSVLYVSNSSEQRKLFLRYDVAADGSVSGERVIADATSSPDPGLPDGMKVDSRGNLFGTGPGGVWVFSPAGVHLGTIRTPESPANVGWGDDGSTLYITAVTSVYRVRLSVEGDPPLYR
jgi:gluconolactonase